MASSSLTDSSNHPAVIGVGASAGGIDALRDFLGGLPGDAPLAILVAVHLDPDRESNLAEVLQAATGLQVAEAKGRVEMEAGHVYVIPPNRELAVEDGELRLDALPSGDPRPHTVDRLFRSLAASGRGAAAVVLSGGGSDGAAGLRAVKDTGGLVLVQDPADAEHSGMPRSALATGVVDATLPAAEMGPALLRMLRHGPDVPAEPDGLGDEDTERFEQILETVRNETGHDFSTYKRSTVLRRIRRRLQVRHVDSLGAYLDVLQQGDGETDALVRELLIGVTRFFRDAEAFEALRERVVPNLFDGKDRDDTVRVWIVGCSTGEEVYSLAMLLREHAETLHAAPDVQIFASDLSEEALQRAREGRYPASIASDVSEPRLRRFFEKEGDTYRVKRALREMVIFARHGVLRDPPFSRLDLISCRNLLIFLRRSAQEKVLQTFHYALRPKGHLFLGTSETTGTGDHFRPVDAEHHLYQAREHSRSLPELLLTQRPVPDPPLWENAPNESQTGVDGREESLHREALERAAPPSLLVDEHREVVHLSERAGRYLQHPGGPLSSDLTELVRPALRPELSEALDRLFGSGEPTVARPVRTEVEGEVRTVYLTVRPAQQEDGAETLALVLFNEGEATPEASAPGEDDGAAPDGDGEKARLRRRLRETRRRLRETRERFKTSREEMQAQNEELRSMNEEYKSATEELETSKEELQSVNEELQTVNAELQQKLDEISEAHSDLKNLVDATDIATIFLGDGLEIRRFTPPVQDLFSIRESDVGRPITELTHNLDYDGFEADAEQVHQELTPVHREVRAESGDWYLMQVRPYRTVNDVIDGVVFTFVDITAQKETERRLRQARDYAQSIVDTVREGLIVLDDDLRVVSANDSFYDAFRIDPGEAEGRRIYEVGGGQWDLPELRELLEDVLPENNVFEDFAVTHTFADAGERTLLMNARRLDHVQKILLAIEDVTERREAMEKLRELAAELTMAEQEERHRVAQVLHDDLQQQLYAMEGKLDLIRQDIDDAGRADLVADVDDVSTWVDEAIATTRRLTIDLSPPILGDENLADALGWLRSQMQEMHDFTVHLEGGQTRRLEDDERVLLFQVVRELLFNAVKYAGTGEATVRIDEPDDPEAPLTIHVIDDGKGFDAGEVAETQGRSPVGFGLQRARERLNLVGGSLEIDSAPGEGTHATIRMPVG